MAGDEIMAGGTEDTTKLVYRTPSLDICARYDNFVRNHANALSSALRDAGCRSAVCFSLACFESNNSKTTWGCLFSYETDTSDIGHAIRSHLESPSVRETLEPLDMDTARFHYAFTPSLRSGPSVSEKGNILRRRAAHGAERPRAICSALYSSESPTSDINVVTIGGVFQGKFGGGQYFVFGVTPASVCDKLTERPLSPLSLRQPIKPPFDRGDGEIRVLHAESSGCSETGDFPADVYENCGLGLAHNLAPKEVGPGKIDGEAYPPLCLVTFQQADLTLTGSAERGQQITIGTGEPQPATELIVIADSGTDEYPRCELTNTSAWIQPRNVGQLFPARKLRLLPNLHLESKDIGAWVMEKTEDGFKAHYQIVALGSNDEVYAVEIGYLLDSLRRAGYEQVTLFDTSNADLGGSNTLSIAFLQDTAGFDPTTRSTARTEILRPKSPDLPLISFEAVLDNGSQTSSPIRVSGVMKAFKKAVHRYTRRNYLNQEFVLIEQLDQWMQKRGNEQSSNSWLVILLTDSYEYHRGIDNYPSLTRICHDIKLSSSRPIFRLFCILLDIGAGHLIEPLSYFLCDDDLPLAHESLSSDLASRRILSAPENAHELARQFVSRQYPFCCRSLIKHEVTKFNANAIIPITRMEPVNDKGQLASVYHIEIPADYVSPSIQELVTDHKMDTDEISYYEFAVKSFSNASDFHDDLSNFVLTQDIPSVVQCLSHYEVQQSSDIHDQSDCQYNLVLELGRLDLSQILSSAKPPVLFRDVFEVWNSLASVIDALCELHSRVAPTETENVKIQGWHADLKPENIIQVRNKWKLADLGFSRFKLSLGKELSKADFVGGTVTYGAPETFSHSSHGTNITPSIDIWSLGAVFSVVATWAVLGAPGVAHFKRVRQAAIHSLITEHPSSKLYTGDYFHSGQDVLPEVTAWHEFLRYSLRRNDTLTGRILDLADQFMLKGDAEDRYNAVDISESYKKYLSDANTNADFEPSGTLWSQHRNMIALAEQEVSDDELLSQHSKPLVAPQRSPPTFPKSPQQYPQGRAWPMSQPEKPGKLTSRPLCRDLETSNTSAEGDAIEAAVTQPSPGVRFQNLAGNSLDQRYDMSWARRTLRLNEKRLRSPTRSLLISAAKRMGMKRKSSKTSDELLAQFYKDRNLVFLVDNGPSMREHWPNATMLLETLVALTKGVSNIRGIDLRFTFQNFGVSQERNVRQFLRAMDAATPKTEFQTTGTKQMVHMPRPMKTDMAATLSELFAEYKEKMKRARGFTIIVLTDGLWAKGDPGDIQEEVSRFAGQFGRPYPRHRPFSIEFVWFGDPDGSAKKLTDLDGQTKEGLESIVDTENWDGSVYKMLLGSFIEGSNRESRAAMRTPFTREDEFDPDSD